MSLQIIQDDPSKYHFKTKDNRHVEIKHKDRRLNFTLNKWNREVSIEASLGMVESDTHNFSGNTIEVEDSKKKIRVYPIDTRTTGELYGDSDDHVQCHDGGLRFELVYKEKPSTNFFDTPRVCKNVRYAKQPFLTPEDIERGISCPINVEGSYAVYHLSKKNDQYMTGKVLHEYRPFAIDAEGNRAWCAMDVDRIINPTNMRITIPQQFLDEAMYPVTIDPDLGYAVIGGSWYNIATSSLTNRRGSAWTMPVNSTANYIRAYVKSTVADTVDCKVFINQKDSGGAGTHAQIATDENLASAAAAHWEEFTLAGEVLTATVVYILNIMADFNDVTKPNFYQLAGDQDGTTAVAAYNEPQTYGAPESPWVVNALGTTVDWSIFVNYPAGWSGKISGVVNPAEIAGVAKADIASVKGVA